jgi:Ca2+-binding RTX toxin-like protein
MVVRQGHLIAVVGVFVIGCAVLLLAVGCSGTRSEAPKEKGHTEATTRKQERTAEATESEVEARCKGTRTILDRYPLNTDITPGSNRKIPVTTNDLPDCPKGGLLKGTDGKDVLDGRKGDDEVRGLGDDDSLGGGVFGDDVIYGGPGDDFFNAGKGDDVLYGGPGRDDLTLVGPGEDVIYGWDGNDSLDATSGKDAERDRLYCGKGKDEYAADKKDFVDSSCEKKVKSFWMPI